MNPTGRDLLETGLRELGLTESGHVDKLVSYLSELERWNRRLGLVNDSGDTLIVRHILDSLAALPLIARVCGGFRSPAGIADLGTGGGLPGIPLACFLPDHQFSLVERSERKCGFLRNAIAVARLHNAKVVAEDFAHIPGPYQIIVFRAFSPITTTFVERVLRMLGPEGQVCAYKGKLARIEREIDGLAPALRSAITIETEPVVVPLLDEERHLVRIENRRSTIAGEP